MSIRKFLAILISSFFYVGYLPLVPGTFGSIAGLVIYWVLKDNPLQLFAALFTCLVLGFLLSGKAEEALGKKDPRQVVIDEVAGMLLSLVFLPFSPQIVLIAFFLFRLFDTLKPYPAALFQQYKGSFGIMSDDIVAGFYTNLVLQVVLRLAGFRTS